MFNINKTILLVIDVQEKLTPFMHEKHKLYANLQKIIKGVKILDIPFICTEQMPSKIGKTILPVGELLNGLKIIEKSSFSCCGSEAFVRTLKESKRNQILITGIEAHICVYQTAAELLAMNYDVQVVADAVSSRSLENKEIALDRIKSLGAGLTSTEMILCELVRSAEHKKFKDILNIIK